MDNAPLARRIFQMRANGMGFRNIAITLNEEQIPPPSDIYYAKLGKPNPNRCTHFWADNTVKQIIRNEVYIGNMIGGKSSTISYKNKKLRQKPKDEWIRVEGTHEALISREVWDLCAALDKERYIKHEKGKHEPSLLTGLVRCADCGTKMHVKHGANKLKDGTKKTYHYFDCGNYRKSGKVACTPHTVSEPLLVDLVLADIREKAIIVSTDEKRVAEQIIKLKARESDSRMAGYEKELREALSRLPEIEKLMMNLYEDRIKGTLPETIFATLMQKYEIQQLELNAQIPVLRDKIQTNRQCVEGATVWIRHIKKYTTLKEADASVFVELVKRVEVGEAYKEDGKTIRDIKVIYRYVGNVDEAMTAVAKEVAT